MYNTNVWWCRNPSSNSTARPSGYSSIKNNQATQMAEHVLRAHGLETNSVTVNPPPPTRTQAQRIFAKFGGARPLALGLKYAPSTVYRWDYPKAKGGTGGVVPTAAWLDILTLAKRLGVFISSDDTHPGEK